MELQEAQTIVAQAQAANEVDTAALFANVKGMTMASMQYVSPVKTAAGSELRDKIVKVVNAQVMLANNLKEYTNTYLNKVVKTADKPMTAEEWIPSPTYWYHTDTSCVVAHNDNDGRFYMFVLYNGARSMYMNTVTGQQMSKEEVAAELTPSASKRLFEDKEEVYNKTNDVHHRSIVRTVSLANVTGFTIQGQTVTGKFVYNGD